MQIVFMGTPDFAVETLKALMDAGHQIVAVVTQPDRPVGRGGHVKFSPVKEVAMHHKIPVLQPSKVREAEIIAQIKKYNPDLIVVVAFGQIIPKELLELPKYGCVNVHASLLPKYRGAAPIQWAILNGEEKTGVTTMQMDEGLDTGDILLQKEIRIVPDETGGSLHDKLAEAGAVLCVKTIDGLINKSIQPIKQGESPTEYAAMLSRGTGKINWKKDAEEIERQVRGLFPWPGTYTNCDGKTIKIWSVRIRKLQKRKKVHPGMVLNIEKECLTVCCGKGYIDILELQLPGKKRMKADAFLRGCPLKEGTVFGD